MRVRVCRQPHIRQRGAAFLLLVITLVVGAAAIFYGVSKPVVSDVEKDKTTAAALEKAKAALIGYAVSVAIDGNAVANRPGDLPCPDTNDDGSTENNCGNATGNQQQNRIGRLPWKTLGLPDLRDGDGERLWYAVSNNFKYNTRTTCNAPGAAGCLNSDTRGTITIRNNSGNIIHDATNTDPASSGAIAVILSPGAVLRQGAAAVQSRTCTGGACNAQGACTTTPATNTPKCNPANYLDISGTEDNANFADGSATNGFINGLIRDASGNVIVNDRLLVITYQDLMPQLEKRVIAEISNCLSAYASANNGRYPWATPVTTVNGKFDDTINTLFGRIPDQPLSETLLGIIPTNLPVVGKLLQTACGIAPGLCMNQNWPNSCPLPFNTPGNSWWNNWKLHVFYGVADAYKPQILFTQPTPVTVLLGGITPPTGCPTCLTVNPPGATPDKRFVVMMAGRQLPGVAGGQPRANNPDRQNPVNYLENGNDSAPSFTQQSSSTTFNDTVRYK
jgi:hypothetical protein